MPSRFKNDCLTSVCDYALTRILGLDFIYIYWYDFIVYDCAVTCILGLNFICTYLV